MRNEIIGIIAEGVEDQGVIKNILRAFGFDGSEILSIRPELSKDATDSYENKQTIGTFQGVKNSCEGSNGKRPDFDTPFNELDYSYIVIHLDTAEIDRQDFSFVRPQKTGNESYSTELRESAINIVDLWLQNKYKDKLFYAIAIEEIEAWCLTLFENKDTSSIMNSKDRLMTCLAKANLRYNDLRLNPKKQKRKYFETFTKKKGLHKKKKLLECLNYNISMKEFVMSLQDRLE